MPHDFSVTLRWHNTSPSERELGGEYSHESVVTVPKHAALVASAATAFGGDDRLWNPEELLMAALAQCHMLSFLYAANQAGVEILDYVDEVEGQMEYKGGAGAMTSVTLRPHVVTEATPEIIERLHEEAKVMCVMRASMNFPINLESVVSLPEPNVN
jgi:organic hydroperoxide reductase OsmC/OhrA